MALEQRRAWAFLLPVCVPIAALIFPLGSLAPHWLLQSNPSLAHLRLWETRLQQTHSPGMLPSHPEPQQTAGKNQLCALPCPEGIMGWIEGVLSPPQHILPSALALPGLETSSCCSGEPLSLCLCRAADLLSWCSAAHTSLLQTQGEIVDVEQPRKLNTSPVGSLKPKEPSLGDQGTVSLAVALTQSTEGDGSSLDSSRSSSYPPQHLLGHKGKTSVDDLWAKLKEKLLKKKLHKSNTIKTPTSLFPHHPQPTRLKDVVEKTPSSWDHKQQDSRLKWQALNPWDVAGALNPILVKSADRHLGDEVEDQAARQNYGSRHKQPKKEGSQHWVGHNQLFYEGLSPVKAEGQPRANAIKAEQRLNGNLDFLSDPLVQSRPAVSSRGEATAEGEHSSLGWHPLIILDTTEEADSMFHNKPWRPHSPHLAPVPGELLERTVHRYLRLLVPHKGLQAFMAHMQRALRKDCRLPQLKHACAKMVSKTGLLLNVLSERQETQGASDHIEQGHLQENISRCMILWEDNKLAKEEARQSAVKFVVLLSIFLIIGVMLKVFFHMCFVSPKGDFQPCYTRIPCLRSFCVNLPQRERKDNKEAQDVEQNRAGRPSHYCPCYCPGCCVCYLLENSEFRQDFNAVQRSAS